MYPPLDYVSRHRERELRRQWKREHRARGMTYPKLATIGMVALTAITIPAEMRAKRIKGLTVTDTSIWLRRMAARELMTLDEQAGGQPRVTWTNYRPCWICKRPLIGLEADHRFRLDLKFEGFRIPCSPECPELERVRLDSKRRKRLTV